MEWWSNGVAQRSKAAVLRSSSGCSRIRTAWPRQGLFPHTPTLSLREREHRPPDPGQFDAHRFFERREAVLPLPEGEAWGEGEQAVGILHACEFSRRVSNTPLLQHSITPLPSFQRALSLLLRTDFPFSARTPRGLMAWEYNPASPGLDCGLL